MVLGREKVNALEASLVTSDKKSSLKEGLEVLLSLYNEVN